MGDREEIELLDGKIARLKVEYEQYFARILKREPVKLRDEIERTVLLYSNKSITNTSLKFRLNALVAKYNSYKQYWTRVLREIEEGTYVRKAEGAEALKPGGAPRPLQPRPVEQPAAPEKDKTARQGGIEELYERYIEARRLCNEPTEGITPEALKKTVEQYRKKVEEQYKTNDVELKVYIKDGKAKLTITPKKAS